MSEEKAWIICPATRQDFFCGPTVDVECHVCHTRLAMDAKNKPLCDRENILPICYECFTRESPKQPGGVEHAGALIGGETYTNVGDALRAIAKNIGPRRHG